jgi:ribosomal protein L29
MQLPDNTPRLPKLPFFVFDGVLLLTAGLIAGMSEKPLHTVPLVGIVVCVVGGAMAAAIPLLADYQRQQDLSAADRQRALEALARTTSDTAEQISIAAASLHTITEQARKNLEAAGQLPQQLQEKFAAINQRLVESAAAETEDLRKELKALRAAEAGKLEAATEKIARIATDITRLETVLREQTAPKAAERAPTPLRLPAMAVPTTTPPPPIVPPAKPAPVEDTLRVIAVAAKKDEEVTWQPEPIPAEPVVPVPEPLSPQTAAAAAAAAAHADEMVKVVSQEEVLLTMPPFASRSVPPPDAKATVPVVETKEPTPRRKRNKTAENADPAAKIPGGAPDTATPMTAAANPGPSPDSVSSSPPSAKPENTVTQNEGPLPAATDPDNSNSSMLELSLDDDTALSPAAGFINENFPTRAPFGGPATPPATAATRVESSIASDGVTRLMATAYIGIGNKLFLRGDGPGLSWEKGVPLQFVSIGKWRWETPDATAAVTVKLYKNDQQECAELGPVTLQPGRQHEVTADF